MKKRHILNLLLCVSMFFCFFTVPVHAEDTSTYLTMEQNQQYNVFDYTAYGNTRYTSFISHSSNDIRLVIFLNGQSIIPIVVSLDTFDSGDVESGRALNNYITPNTGCVVDRRTYNNVTFYAGHFYTLSSVTQYHSTLQFITANTGDYGALKTLAYRYAFGDLAVDPAPPRPNWGNVADVNISTIYSGNVDSSPANIDKFTWNNNQDTNGISYISNLMEHPVVEIQAVPVTWKTSTREEMENQTGTDATVGTGVVLGSVNARTGHLEITWQEVINYLQIEYADIYSYFFDGEYWIQRGWFYRIRLVADDYEGPWITLSNGLNLTPKKSKKLIEDPYDETTYQILKEISETNNQGTTVYEFNNNYITVNTDPASGWQDPNGGGSFWDFLASVVKAISDGIASIVSSVASLVGDLVNGILGLFTFDTFEINNYNTEVQTLKDNSGIFGQSIEFADSIKDSIRGVEQQPAVLHFDGIVIDNVQLIPAVDLDFDQMVVDAGLTDFHNLVYVFTDGTILISLIIMVHRKLMEVLRK